MFLNSKNTKLQSFSQKPIEENNSDDSDYSDEFSSIVSKRLEILNITIIPNYDENNYRIFNEEEDNKCYNAYLKWNDDFVEHYLSTEFKNAEYNLKRLLRTFDSDKIRLKQKMDEQKEDPRYNYKIDPDTRKRMLF